jgi:hypothetical protein
MDINGNLGVKKRRGGGKRNLLEGGQANPQPRASIFWEFQKNFLGPSKVVKYVC